LTSAARKASPWLGVALLLLAAAAGAQAPAPEREELTLGVAPFEVDAAEGLAGANLGAALAEALRARGATRVLGPAELGAGGARASAGEAAGAAAERTAVDALVLGRATRLGGRLSLDVRLRATRSGAVVGTYVAESAAAESPEAALGRLAEQILQGAQTLDRDAAASVPEARAVASVGSAETLHDASAPAPAAVKPLGLEALGDDEPLSIRSDELEATDQAGARTLVFRRNVEVRRGDLTLRAQWLEAFYPAGAKQPRDLSARGGVTVAQAARSARCREATYTHESQRIVCTGEAELRDAGDRIQGDRIVFALRERQVRVEGNVQVDLAPRALSAPDATPPPGAPESFASEAPLAIRADRLRAYDRDGRREIVFEGSVEVVRSDVTLRSERLEALYPEHAEQPEQLVATGAVALSQGTREARCERAVYDRARARVECSGEAELWDGEDRVRGEVIAFDLEARTVVVRGGTRLLLRPGDAAETALP